MSGRLSSICDDFYIDMCVGTELELPTQRDTILAFFERIGKQYPSMSNLSRRGRKEYYLESPQNTGQYRWVCIDADRLAGGVVNPETFEDAYAQHKLVLELAPYMLSLSHLDIDSLDLTVTMDFDCPCNHDEVISEALLSGSAFSSLFEIPGSKPVGVSPVVIMSLTEDSCTQARVSVESKTAGFDPRKEKDTQDQAISLSLTIRQYPQSGAKFEPVRSFDNQSELLESLLEEKIIPCFARPLINTIAHRRLS
ncbi:MAG: hypothetical protein WC374_04545 [Phycisphaerae bacterium]|jgi:hypothetical protein